MRSIKFYLLVSLCAVSGLAQAALFPDSEARERVKQLEARVAALEEQSVRSLLDLQTQLDTVTMELRKLRGQNEEFAYGLQDAEKRQRDFYIDLDERLRRLEPYDETVGMQGDTADETEALEAAYELYQRESYKQAAAAFQAFLKRYPQSKQEANVLYWMGNAYFLTQDSKQALEAYQVMLDKYSDHARMPQAMLNMAECQLDLNFKTAAKKTLNQVVTQFPNSDAASKAKKRLATLK